LPHARLRSEIHVLQNSEIGAIILQNIKRKAVENLLGFGQK